MKTLYTLLFITLFFNSFAQSTEKIASLVVSGSGKTKDAAIQSALRSAIEQAFGAFISSKTEMLNDQVVADQMASVSSGNIQSFKILNEAQLPDSTWSNTVKATVSIDKLTSFVESKGVIIEFKGSLFSLNIKQQKLNEENEVNVVSNMFGILHETMQKAFDYSIEPTSSPQAIPGSNDQWKIPLEITVRANKNVTFISNFLIRTLEQISMDSTEQKNYETLGKPIYAIDIYSANNSDSTTNSHRFFLRSYYSLEALKCLGKSFEFYVRNYNISINGISDFKKQDDDLSLDMPSIFFYQKYLEKENTYKIYQYSSLESVSHEDHTYRPFIEDDDLDNTTIEKFPNYVPLINFDFSERDIAHLTFNYYNNLSEIEKIQSFKITSKGVTSRYDHGGIVIEESNGHGLVCSIYELENTVNSRRYGTYSVEIDQYRNRLNLAFFTQLSQNTQLNGFKDWKIPTENEFKSIISTKQFVYSHPQMNFIGGYATIDNNVLSFLNFKDYNKNNLKLERPIIPIRQQNKVIRFVRKF